MNFKINIHLTDEDYLEYNLFWMLRSPYGKQQMLTFRILIAACFAAITLLSLFMGDFSQAALLRSLPYPLLLILFEVFWSPFLARVLKSHLKSLKKKGKMGYSPYAEIEFFDDRFAETTPEGRTEQTYSSLERISVIGETVIYLHVNNVMAYIVPRASFDSEESFAEFLAFIKTKCSDVTRY